MKEENVQEDNIEIITTSIRLPKDLINKLKRKAQNLGISFNAYVTYLLNQGHQD